MTLLGAIMRELPRMAAIAAVSLGLAIGANAVHPMKLPLLLTKGQPGLPSWVASRFQQADAQGAMQLMENPELLVVDTRDEKDFIHDHISGAIFLPYHGFNDHYPRFAENVPKDRPLLLYCYGSDCGLAGRVGKRLITYGYTNVTILRNGIEGWKAANLPLETREKHDES